VAESSCGKCTCKFNMFVAWRDALAEPRVTLPASDGTVALHLQSVMSSAKASMHVKTAYIYTAIAFYPKINLFDNGSMQSLPDVCVVRSTTMRRFGLNTENRKDIFEWVHVVDFTEAYGVRHQGYCRMVIATMAVVTFDGMCRYDDASGLTWRNVTARFVEDGSGFE
jgi:hypothetical protein